MAQVLKVGKYKGCKFEDAAQDRGYCSWILQETSFSKPLAKFQAYLVKKHVGIVTVGKHKRKFYDEVLTDDPDYCDWVTTLKEPTFFAEFQQYLKDKKLSEEDGDKPPSKKVKETTSPTNSTDKCKICYDNIVGCVFIPCGHLACCLRCGLRCDRDSGACPICQQEITLVTQTFRA